MKNILLFLSFVCVLVCSVLYIDYAKAESILFFAPTRLELTDKNPISEVRVTNTSKAPRSYSVNVENIAMANDGVTYRVEDFDYSAKRMIRYVPRRFDLEPGQMQIVRVMARIPSSVADGSYHAHLEFLEDVKRQAELRRQKAEADGGDSANDASQAQIEVKFAYSAAIPIVVTKGEINTEVQMQNVRVERNEQGEPEVLLDIVRSGNGQGNIFLEADYVTPDAKTMQAASRRTVFVYREIDIRHHRFTLNMLGADFKAAPNAQVNVRLYNRDVSSDEPVQEVSVPFN